MGKKELTVTFETVTPLWTGDINGECTELKPASIFGSLRFWFEVYCYFAGIEVKENESLDYKTFEKIRNKTFEKYKYKDKEISDIEEYIIKNLPLTTTSKIFGCTGWKSRIEIKKVIKIDEYEYIYPLGKISLEKLEYNKQNKTIIPSWYFKKGFFGKFRITFNVLNEVGENILLPLLKFIERYGFIGAKNNIGYGRVKIIEPTIENNEIDLNCIGVNNKITNSIFQEKDLPDELNRLNYKAIEVFNIKKCNNLNDCIKNLLSKKVKLRRFESNKFIRHYKFGSIAKDIYKNKRYNLEIKGPNATKIIPLISFNKSTKIYNGQFLSIWGIQNIGAKK
ncbi:type III-B CRISPR module RAMP protein Cmr1 [Caminibacter mediatlanticus TB-2]|uniref:Type III-B CRISPR module RAMP protein Cmr1 n=1 Tax=Caminibacter mediatlanticus TB-2 TaxID=391592 RepID=A0ABX5V9J8_9BACT|nr:type III-B CRISPR module RAMP protein Cmr1 [Caminibacter mediatlanticus]QCT94970.1 type III-B CRISPR module RAMP protein Cmr1 [Caminibacter mediatlanticus TB-2]